MKVSFRRGWRTFTKKDTTHRTRHATRSAQTLGQVRVGWAVTRAHTEQRIKFRMDGNFEDVEQEVPHPSPQRVHPDLYATGRP